MIRNIKGKVFVVDDTPSTVGLLRETLEQEGYRVFIATSGDKAVDRVEQIMPDVILLDVLMPGIDGFETCRRLKSNEKVKDIPILFMTGLSAIESKVKGFQVGAIDYVTKPIEIDEVLSRIRTHISLKKIQTELLSKNVELQNEINERENAENKIKELNQNLEKRVDSRTQELAKVNRTLRILSDVNHLIVRSNFEEELLESAVKIIIDSAGYKNALFGILDSKLYSMKIWHKEAAPSQEYKEESISIGRIDVDELNNLGFFKGNLITSEKLASVTKIFNNGFKNYILLPLLHYNTRVPFIIIYFEENFLLDKDELIMLTEVAEDLSFGFKSLKERSELEDADKQLRETEILFQQVSQQSQVVVWSVDKEGNFQFISETAFKVLGFRPDEVQSKMNFFDFVPDDDSDEIKKFVRKLIIQRKEVRDHEVKLLTKSKSIIWASCSGFPIFDKNGKFCGGRGSLLNITERKKMIDELINSKEVAEHASRLKDTLLSNLSHEFRTPLNGILGFAQLLEEDGGSDPIKLMGTKIRLSGLRLLNTLNSVLTLTELESRRSSLNITEFNLVELLSEIKVSLHSLIMEHELSFNIESAEELVEIISDESLLRKMIYNIAENAVRFTHSGGVRIKVTVPTVTGQNDFVTIAIIDSGIGIKKEDHNLIFKEFRQASEGYRRHYEGLGLGLNISQKIAEILKTEITLESEVGIGSTFTLKIPRQIGEIKDGSNFSNPSNKEESAVPKLVNEIMVIEDNPINAEVLQWFLSKFGNVTTSMNGETALSLSNEKIYDLFLIDINLGKGMDGIEILNKLRINPLYQNTPMVAVTGYASDLNKKELIEKGFNHFLAKPVAKNEVINLVKDIFNIE